MSRTLCCCCFSNNVRHLILLLCMLSASLLFSNILLFNATVLQNSKDFQLALSSEETHISTQPFGRIRREVAAETNHSESRQENHAEQFESSVVYLDVLDVNETVTQQIASEVLADEEEDGPGESANFTTPETTILVTNMTDMPTIQKEITLSTGSPLKSTQPSSISGPSFETSSSVDAQTENGETQEGESSKVPSERDDEKKKITDVKMASLEKKISLILLWVSPGIGTFLGAVPSIWLLRAIGERKLFAGSLFLSSVATFWLAFMLGNEWNQFAIAALRFIQGIAFATTFPVIGSISANWGTLKEQFFFLAWSIFFVELAPVLNWPMCALFLKYDYKLPYMLQAVTTLIFALIWIIFHRDRPQYHPWVNGLELNKIVTGKVRAINNRALDDQPFHLLLKSASVWAIWVAVFGYLLVITLLSQFLPIYFYSVLGQEETNAILLASIPFSFIFVFALLHGLFNLLMRGCGEWLSIILPNTISFSLCAVALIMFSIFPLNDLGIPRIVFVFTGFLICCTVSLYGFGWSAVVVGRYFTQHIVANIQLLMGLAMLITSAVVLLTVRSNSPNEWRPVFLISAALLLICAAIFGVFGDSKAEEWAKQSWDPSAARRMISVDQIDYHHDECGIVEMRLLNQ